MIVLVSVGLLAVAARSMLETDLGISQIRGLPADSEPKRAAEAAERGFAPGILSPTVLLLEGVDRRLDLPGLVRLQRALAEEQGVAAAVGPASPLAREIPGLVFGREESARYLLVLDEEPQGSSAHRGRAAAA